MFRDPNPVGSNQCWQAYDDVTRSYTRIDERHNMTSCQAGYRHRRMTFWAHYLPAILSSRSNQVTSASCSSDTGKRFNYGHAFSNITIKPTVVITHGHFWLKLSISLDKLKALFKAPSLE